MRNRPTILLEKQGRLQSGMDEDGVLGRVSAPGVLGLRTHRIFLSQGLLVAAVLAYLTYELSATGGKKAGGQGAVICKARACIAPLQMWTR